MILYMLRCSGIKLTTSDISDFIVEKGYTDAFTLQININELIEANLIKSEKKHNRSFLELTEEGHESSILLETRLSKDVRSSIYNYIAINKNSIRSSHSIQTKIDESPDGRYICQLSCQGKTGELYGITLSFPAKSLAEEACNNFSKHSTDIYRYIIDKIVDA